MIAQGVITSPNAQKLANRPEGVTRESGAEGGDDAVHDTFQEDSYPEPKLMPVLSGRLEYTGCTYVAVYCLPGTFLSDCFEVETTFQDVDTQDNDVSNMDDATHEWRELVFFSSGGDSEEGGDFADEIDKHLIVKGSRPVAALDTPPDRASIIFPLRSPNSEGIDLFCNEAMLIMCTGSGSRLVQQIRVKNDKSLIHALVSTWKLLIPVFSQQSAL